MTTYRTLPQERIVKAAIMKGEVIFTTSIEKGRHYDIFRELSRAGVPALPGCQQGFVTDTGRFVGREMAAAIALDAQQVLKESVSKVARDRILYSEDLW